MTATIPTVNDVIARYPATVAVFNRFGIDACCGGAVPVREAAVRDGVDLTDLLAALELALASSDMRHAGDHP